MRFRHVAKSRLPTGLFAPAVAAMAASDRPPRQMCGRYRSQSMEEQMDNTFDIAFARQVKRWLVLTYIAGFGAGWLVCLFTH
jgi:hypothetical protein